jgi:hypothetical protein
VARGRVNKQLQASAALVLVHYHTLGVKGLIRQVLWEAQDGRCLLCEQPMLERTRHPRHKDRDTLEHVWPIGIKGADHPGNLALSHAKCNNLKGGRGPTEAEHKRLLIINERLGWPTVRTWGDVARQRGDNGKSKTTGSDFSDTDDFAVAEADGADGLDPLP